MNTNTDRRGGKTVARTIEALRRLGARMTLWARYPREDEIDPRQDMENRLTLPRWLLDWFTGKPILDGRSGPNRLDPLAYLALDMGLALLGVAGVVASMLTAPWWASLVMVPALWMVIVGRLRKMQTLEGHEAAHGNFFLQGDPRRDGARRLFGMTVNDFLGEVATTFALSQNMVAYRRDHDLHHAVETYTTDDDPDAALVRSIRKGFVGHLLNPIEYGRDFAQRLHANLVEPGWRRRVMGAIWVASLLGLAAVLPLATWLAAVVAPWVILFRLAALLQIVSLHAWLLPRVATLDEYAERTWARFSGVRLPKRGLAGFAWAKAWTFWWAEIALVELPFRVGVLSPDLQAHDAHHMEYLLVFEAKALDQWIDDWRNQPFRRGEMIRDSGDHFGMSRREVWGVRAMMAVARQNLE